MRGAFGHFRSPNFMRNAIQTVVREELGSCRTNSPSPIVHTGFKCDGCGVAPIRGTRYRCYTCVDFNLCETCESTTSHHHPFVKLTSPEGKSDDVVYAASFSANDSPTAA